MRKKPRTIVITGASSGIGRALARAYAAPGMMLGLVGREAARIDACGHDCRAMGAEVVTASIDVRDAQALEAWLHAFDTTHPIDLLIANAGVASTLASVSDWEDLNRTARIVDTNLYGVLHTVLPVIDRMRSRRRGQIALVSSLAALRGMAISPAYCASKAATKAWGDSIRPVLARDGVTVSVILPGFVQTPMCDVFPGYRRSMWSAQRAASHIRRKLASGRTEIAFPAHLALGMRLLALLPAALADVILSWMSYLPRGGH